MYNNCNNYNNCNQLNCDSSIVLTPGTIGPTGDTGPTGPIGVGGVDGINIPNNFIALETVNTDVPVLVGSDTYTAFPFLAISAQQGNDVIAIPDAVTGEYTQVTLTAGHTYLIAFNTNGVTYGGQYNGSYRVVVNGVPIPEDGNDGFKWLTFGSNSKHTWIYQATVDTTIEYQGQILDGGTETNVSGIYLTIITLV